MAKKQLENLVRYCLERVFSAHGVAPERMPQIHLERPRDSAHGDWATNVAMASAGTLGAAPRVVAGELLESLNALGKPVFLDTAEIAGPGFINFRFSNRYLYDELAGVLAAREKYGHLEPNGERVQIEFVSANPVGPMHVGHGRWAAIGDSLARLLTASGCRVEKEFYVNDFGNQMLIFGLSVAARYREELGEVAEFPADGYQGHYVKEIASEIITKEGGKYLSLSAVEQGRAFAEIAYRQVLEHIRTTLLDMDVVFESWFCERQLHETGAVQMALERLRVGGWVYEKDGAVWVKTTSLGDDKDRVAIREDGRATYFAADIAYHLSKLERGFDKIINIWGADHHGYVARMRAIAQALGAKPDWMEIIIGQLVNLYQGGNLVRMSKRTGEMVTLEELLREVGKDASRYFFLMRSTDTALDFDIDLAKSKTNENPVYYVQYAHARISSILKLAAERGLENEEVTPDLSLLVTEPELDLIREIGKLPAAIKRAAALRTPHRLTQYAEELASRFHYFYHHCRVVTDERELSRARLALVRATKYNLANVLDLLGVSAPESM